MWAFSRQVIDVGGAQSTVGGTNPDMIGLGHTEIVSLEPRSQQ